MLKKLLKKSSFILIFSNLKQVLYHNYIIENTTYDVERSDNGVINYKSDTAYGPLFEHQAICSGYTDLMAIFLDKFGIKNLSQLLE